MRYVFATLLLMFAFSVAGSGLALIALRYVFAALLLVFAFSTPSDAAIVLAQETCPTGQHIGPNGGCVPDVPVPPPPPACIPATPNPDTGACGAGCRNNNNGLCVRR